jgi:hypothetical protein
MKKISFLLIFVVATMKINYSQSLHTQKHKKIRTACKTALNDTCQSTRSYTIFLSSNEVNKRTGTEFPAAPAVVCPVANDDIYRIMGRALKGIQIAY